MKVLVTGASGFIGSTLIEQLTSLGFEVFALMRSTSSSDNLKGLKFSRIEGDLRDANSLKRAVEGMSCIYHVAGVTAAANRAGYFEHNAGGTARLAQAVANAKPTISRFVLVSSLAAAGPTDSLRARTEDEPSRPVSWYGQSKLEGERELLKYKDKFPVAIIRPPIVYGPKDKGVFVLVQTVSRNLMPLISGRGKDGHKYYSSVHAADLCQGIVQAAVAPANAFASGEVFYVSADGHQSYREMLEAVAQSLDKDPLTIKVPPFIVKAAAVALDAAGLVLRKSFPLNKDKLNELLPDYWICSNAKARQILKFEPQYDWHTGIAKTIEWYKTHQWL